MADIIFKHGTDDFSFWQVDIDERDMKPFYHKGTITGGTLDELMNLIEDVDSRPNTVNFFNIHGDDYYGLWSVEADKTFFEKYCNEGCSVRGNYTDIKNLIEDYSTKIVEAVMNRMYGFNNGEDDF